MSERIVFDMAISGFWIAFGLIQWRRTRTRLWPRREFLTLGRNPVAAEPMTPRWRTALRLTSAAIVAAGALGLALSFYRFLRG